MGMVEGIMGEIKQHPYTSVSAIGCFLFSAVAIPFLWSDKASATDVQGVAHQVAEVRLTVQRESTATELNNVRRELFDVDLRIRMLEHDNMSVDPLLYRRREDLTGSQRLLEVKLRDIDQALQ